jgi:hypothetical protein
MSLGDWLLLVISLPGRNPAVRMRIWRALRSAGAGAMRDGVYVLPSDPASRTVMSQQAAEAEAAGGSGLVVHFSSEGDDQEATLRALFARDADYAALLERLQQLQSALAGLSEGEARKQLAGLGREVAALGAIDFFPTAAREQVQVALADAGAALDRIHAPGEPHAATGLVSRIDKSAYQKRAWATRRKPWVDRLASAWLIRRFIDPGARFAWLAKPKDCPKAAVGFDFDGAEFTHVGARVTFEVLLASFGLDQDPALTRLGSLVHFLDVGGVPVPEAEGLVAILTGYRAQALDDDALLAAASSLFDALYAAYHATPASGN